MKYVLVFRPEVRDDLSDAYDLLSDREERKA